MTCFFCFYQLGPTLILSTLIHMYMHIYACIYDMYAYIMHIHMYYTIYIYIYILSKLESMYDLEHIVFEPGVLHLI